MKIALILYQAVKYPSGQEYGHPIDSTQNMPDSLVTWAALFGAVFIGYFCLVYYRRSKKKKRERPYTHQTDADLPFEKNDDNEQIQGL